VARYGPTGRLGPGVGEDVTAEPTLSGAEAAEFFIKGLGQRRRNRELREIILQKVQQSPAPVPSPTLAGETKTPLLELLGVLTEMEDDGQIRVDHASPQAEVSKI
jgi:hypothetical protein